MKEEDFSKILEMEEAYIKKTCDDIIRYSPDLVSFELSEIVDQDNCFRSLNSPSSYFFLLRHFVKQ
jgi:hypothetical protein